MALSKAEQKELWDKKTKPIVCGTLADIKQALVPFLISGNTKKVEYSLEIKWSDEGKQKTDKVLGVSTDCSLRATLIDGFNIIKRRIEAADKIKQAVEIAQNSGEELPVDNFKVWDTDSMRFNVDSLIHKKLGGKRVGLRVRWIVKEGCFEFDPYTNKLFQITEEKT